MVWTLYRLSSQRVEGWESSSSGDTGIHAGFKVRVAEEDEAMKIGPWVARKRKAFWAARFAVAVANCNASMTALSISLIEPSLEILVTFFQVGLLLS